MRHSARNRLHASIAATPVIASASANTGSVVTTFTPPHDSTTSPVWSATQAAPAAASAINSRNRMIRYIGVLLPRLRQRRHGLGRESTGCRQRRIARAGLVDPPLRGGAVGGRQRHQFAPGLVDVVA